LIAAGPSLPWVREGQRISLGSAAVFLALVPVLIGFLLGATRAGVALYFPWPVGILFWVISSAGVWACLFAGSWGAAALLRPWHPPLWLVLTVGAVLGSAAGRYFIYGAAAGLQDYMLAGRTPQSAPGFEFSISFASNYLQGWAGVYVTWIVVGLVFDRWLTLSRSVGAHSIDARCADGSAEKPMNPALGTEACGSDAGVTDPHLRPNEPLCLLSQMERDVVAVEAEDHYVRIHTESGSALVFMRFSDAIARLARVDGLRVHRSYWVRRCCVASVEAQGRGLMLTLSNGLRVPVSHGYKEVARQAGLQPPMLRYPFASAAPPSAR